ncbi:MAG: DUF3379 domain-containing protein [Gammaproteobacteria bacterium]|nr:DUF3379 domain-containing protein [Gammaproteobacteria bacterium]
MSSEQDKELQALDLKIAKALQIDVPELRMPELPDIETANVSSLPAPKRSMKPVWFAIAATVVLATSISLKNSSLFQTYDSLADEVLAHLDHEPGAFRNVDVAVSDERLARAIPASLATFQRGESLITYAQPCVINGKDVPHLVIQGQYGPITILLMPYEEVAKEVALDGENVKGVILPVGKGSIAIIGDREERLEPIQKNVVNSVSWTT